MTALRSDLTRQTSALYRGRELCFRATAHGCLVKLKGQRWTSAYFVPWAAVYQVGGKLAARAAQSKPKRRPRKLRGVG